MVDNYEYFYQGQKYGFEPTYGDLFTGYQVSAGSIGSSTGVQTANQIKDVTNFLNQGMKVIEVSTIQPEVFDMIPKQHLQEINRLTKLTGAEVTFHAPIVEPSGFTQQGWSEQNREEAERQMSEAIIRAHEMNPKGNMPATFHSSSIPGSEYTPAKYVKELSEDEKTYYRQKYGEFNDRTPIMTTLVAVNQESGELMPLRREKEYYPGEAPRIETPQKRLEILNDSHFSKQIANLSTYKKNADDLIASAMPELQPLFDKMEKGELTREDMQSIGPAYHQVQKAQFFLQDVGTSFRKVFEEASKFSGEDEKKVLEEVSKKWQDFSKEEEKMNDPLGVQRIIKRSELYDDSLRIMHQLITTKGLNAPQLFKPIDEFAKDKASETFSTVALNAYKKFGEKAPIVSIENPPYGSAMSSGQELKSLVEETRKKFVEKAVEKGFSRGEAKNAAEKLIGVTWDTSHISMMRKEGYDERSLIEEAKKVAPFVKHVHLNDNFGYSHTDLPPGMGNVPIGEIMQEFAKKGYKGRKIFEGGNFFQHFQTPPHAMVLEAMGSPIYGMVAQPGWNQAAGTYGGYSLGYGKFLPEQHFSLYGTGWTTLPVELGGQVGGAQSRFSGTPNE